MQVAEPQVAPPQVAAPEVKTPKPGTPSPVPLAPPIRKGKTPAAPPKPPGGSTPVPNPPVPNPPVPNPPVPNPPVPDLKPPVPDLKPPVPDLKPPVPDPPVPDLKPEELNPKTPGVQPESPENNPTHHILHIGDSSLYEIIELNKSSIESKSNFNVLGTGGTRKELKEYYGINENDIDKYNAMRIAFGVKNPFNNPPILEYIKLNCQFKGFDIVKTALETRIKTLSSTIGNTSKGRRQNQLIKVFTKLLDSMKLITEPCKAVVTEPIKSVNTPTDTKCPCLDDVNILRDLVVLIAMMQGVVNPQIKAQLSKIPLKNIITTVQKNNSSKNSNSKQLIQKILQILQSIIVSETGTSDESTMKYLKEIYVVLDPTKSLSNTETNETIVKNIITLIKSHIATIATLTAEKDSCTTDIDMLTKRLEEKTLEFEELSKRIDVLETIKPSDDPTNVKVNLAELITLQLEVHEANRKKDEAEDRLKLAQDMLGLQKKIDTLLAELAALKAKGAQGAQGAQGTQGGPVVPPVQGNQVEIDRITAEMEKLKKELEEKNKLLSITNITITELNARIIQLELAAKEAKENADRIAAENNAKMNEIMARLGVQNPLGIQNADELKRLQEELNRVRQELLEKIQELLNRGSQGLQGDESELNKLKEELEALKKRLGQTILLPQPGQLGQPGQNADLSDELEKMRQLLAKLQGLQGQQGQQGQPGSDGQMADQSDMIKILMDLIVQLQTLLKQSQGHQGLPQNEAELARLRGEVDELTRQLKKCQDDADAALAAKNQELKEKDELLTLALENMNKGGKNKKSIYLLQITQLQEQKDRCEKERDELSAKIQEFLNAHRQKLAILEGHVRELEAEIENERALLGKWTEELNGLLAVSRNHVNELEADVRALEKELNESKGKFQQTDLELELQLRKYETINQALGDRIKELERQLAEKTANLAEKTDESENKDTLLAELEKTKLELQTCKDDTLAKQTEYDAMIKSLEEQLKQAREDLQKTKRDLDALVATDTTERESLKSILAEKEAAILALEAKLAAKDGNKTEEELKFQESETILKNRIAALELDLKNLTESSQKERDAATNALEAEKESCKEQLRQAEAKYAELQTINKDLQAQLTAALLKTTESDASKAALESLQAEKAASDQDCGKVRADLAELQGKLTKLEEEHAAALKVKDSEIDTERRRANNLNTELKGRPTRNNMNAKNSIIREKETEIETLTKRITELEEQQKAKEQEHTGIIASLKTELEVAQQSSKNEKASSTTTELELANLRIQLQNAINEKSKAEADVTRLTDLLQTTLNGKNAIQTQLDTANETVRTLEANITSLKTQIKELEEKLAAAKADTLAVQSVSNTKVNRATLNSTKKNLNSKTEEVERLKTREIELLAEIKRLEGELETAGNDKGALKASLEAMKSELATIKEQLKIALENVARLTVELANTKTTAKANSNAKTANSSKAVAEIQAKLDALRAEKTTSDEEHVTELEALKKQLTDANTTIREQAETIKTQLSDIDALTQKLSNMPDSSLELENFKTESKKRLQNLLIMLLVDESVIEEAKEYIFGSGTLSEQNIKTITRSISSGTCEYFRYLNDLLSIQLEFIRSISDIFKSNNQDIFATVIPNYENENHNELLKEITMLFQEFFLNTDITNLSNGSYTNLIDILTRMGDMSFISKLVGVKKQQAIKELQRYSLLSKYKVVLNENSNIQIIKSPIEDEKSGGIPLVILSIKMVQLINEVLHDKRGLFETCGIHITEIAIAQGPKLVK